MLDTHKYNFESKVVAVTKEIEKSVSPDKVAEIYKDLKETAENQVVRAIYVDGNSFHGVVVEMARNNLDRTKRIYTKFIINSEEHIQHTDVTDDMTNEQMVDKLFDDYKSKIATKLVKESLKIVIK